MSHKPTDTVTVSVGGFSFRSDQLQTSLIEVFIQPCPIDTYLTGEQQIATIQATYKNYIYPSIYEIKTILKLSNIAP